MRVCLCTHKHTRVYTHTHTHVYTHTHAHTRAPRAHARARERERERKVCHHGISGKPSWWWVQALEVVSISQTGLPLLGHPLGAFACLLGFYFFYYKVCHYGLQGMPLWTSRYAIMDFKLCHHGLQGMPSWTSRYAIMDFMVFLLSFSFIAVIIIHYYYNY